MTKTERTASRTVRITVLSGWVLSGRPLDLESKPEAGAVNEVWAKPVRTERLVSAANRLSKD